MKVLIYNGTVVAPGGILTATEVQKKALESVGIEVTTDPNDTYDIADINFIDGKTPKFIKKLKKKGIPVVVHAHSTDADFKYSFRLWPLVGLFFQYPLLKKVYTNADFVIPVSYFCKHNIETDVLQHHVPMKVVNNAVDFDFFNDKEKYIQKFKDYFNITNEKVVIGIGLPFNRKGIKDFIEVARHFPDIKFIWFGGASKIITESNILKAIKNKPNNVIMPGYMRNEVFKGAFAVASCLFFPTYCENDGIVALEALISGVPLLTRDIGALEWLEDNKVCLKGHNNEEFIEKLTYILNNDCSYLIKNGLELINSRKPEVIGQQLKEVYETVLKLKK